MSSTKSSPEKDRLLEAGEADSLVASVPVVDYNGSCNTSPLVTSAENSISPERTDSQATPPRSGEDEVEKKDEVEDDGKTCPAAPHADANLPPLRRAFFCVLPLFMGYAVMVTMQGKIKERLEIGDNSSARSYEFSFATSLIYMGNLVFRLLHNIIYSMFRPRIRVCIAYLTMCIAVGTLAVGYYIINSKSLAFVYVSYLLAGTAIGTFESNFMSSITPLGHQTKVWAQYGIPLGFSGISIGGFALFAINPANANFPMSVYLFVSASNLLAIFFWMFAIPDIKYQATQQDIRAFWGDVKEFRNWLPMVVPYAASLFVDMFGVSLFSALPLWIYDLSHMPLWPGCKTQMSLDVFRMLYNLASMLGDSSGRKLAYRTPKHIRPYWFLILTCSGAGLICSKVTILAPVGMLLLMHANGEVYSHSTKYIDDKVGRRYNLVSLSLWLFVGDVGSFVGANLANAMRVAVGGVEPLH